MDMWTMKRRPSRFRFTRNTGGQGIGSQLMVRMLELLKWQGYEKASLAVQKANYAVKMYENVGSKTVDENAEEYIMVCEL